MNTSGEFGSALKSAGAEIQGQREACFESNTKLESPVLDATLPEEILEKIFLSNLNDSKDLEAVSNATPQFRRIVKPSMPVWAIDQIFPLVFSQLDKKDILQCRLVCKKWNRSVDRYVQDHPKYRSEMPYPYHPTETRYSADRSFIRSHPDYRPNFHPNLYSKKWFAMTLSSVDKIVKTSNKMEKSINNPFVTRRVTFSNSDDDGEMYWYFALNFLEKYGKHIWHAVVEGPEGTCPLFKYQVLHKSLCFMPNIRTLELYGYEGGHSDVGNNLRRYTQEHPLPSLPHLHTINDVELAFKHKFGQFFVDEMLQRYSGQLTTLITTVRRELPPRWNTLTRMTALNLFMYQDTYQAWEHFVCSSSAPQLAKLKLAVCASKTVSISKLLKPLQRGFPSLVYLHIWFSPFPNSRIHKGSGEPRFLMENVRTLELNDHPSLQFNHILSFFPALEYVVVSHKYKEPIHCDVNDEEEMELRMRMRFRSMYKSDIWTRIKTLKEFTLVRSGDPVAIFDDVVERQFTRDGYERYVGDRM